MKKRICKTLALLLALVLAAALGGCGLLDKLTGGKDEEPASAPESEVEIDPEYPVEAGGVRLMARPGKLVSLAPALTEKVYDLGMDDRLVGVSDYCDYPAAATALQPCGTAQLPDVEAIVALAPHIVISEAPLPEDVAAELLEQDIPVAVFPHAASTEALMQTYLDLARLLEGDQAGELIGSAFTADFRGRLDTLRSTLSAYTEGAGRKKVLYLRLLDFTVATGDTFEQELLDILCMENIAAPYSEWAYPEDAAKGAEGQAAFASVDIIYMDEDFVTIKDLEQSAFYKGLPATIKDRYLYISSLTLERQSLRTVDEMVRMAEYAYPDAAPGGFSFDSAAVPAPEEDPAGFDGEGGDGEGGEQLSGSEEGWESTEAAG